LKEALEALEQPGGIDHETFKKKLGL
jgi:hypothetical protein